MSVVTLWSELPSITAPYVFPWDATDAPAQGIAADVTNTLSNFNSLDAI
jgi:hypothetical protein